jgi:clostripain
MNTATAFSVNPDGFARWRMGFARLAERVGMPVLRAEGSSSDGKRTVTGTRRRPSGSSSGSRERAEAPTRDDRPSSGGSAPPPPPPPQGPSGPSGGGYTPSGGGSMPSGPGGGMNMRTLLIIGGFLLLLFVCGGPSMLMGGLGSMFSGGGGDQQQVQQAMEQVPQVQQDQAAPAAQQEPVPTVAANVGQVTGTTNADGETWTVMLYQDADDKVLEQDIYIDLNEAERVGSTPNVNIVAQVDRYRGGFSGDGDWTDTRRYYVTQDGNLERLGSQALGTLGEVSMAEGETLVDFVTWTVENFPADKYVLILSDHGMGWPGGWSDSEPRSGVDRSIPIASALGSALYLNELDDALAEIRQRTGIDKFELIGMDACLMSHAEVFSALEPHARYAVASQETEPALGWAYTSFLNDLTRNPNMSGAEVAKAIVDSYIQDDQRVVDDQARAAFLSRGSPFGGPVMSAGQLARKLEDNITLTAIDLEQMANVTNALNDFAYTLTGVDQNIVAKARTYAQSFTSIFGQRVPPSYIDIVNFAQLIKQQTRNADVNAAADNVIAAIGNAVIENKNGPKKPGANGISVYFPNSQLYGSPVAGPQSYTAVAARFAGESVWDDFLAYHYTGRRFQPAERVAAVPDRAATVAAPGQGVINIAPVQLSDDVAAPGQPVLMSADISGENIGYIYLYAGYLDQANNSVYVADMDYIDSGEIRDVGGVFYPEWGEGDFTLEFEWEPIVFALRDGTNTELALLRPQSYGLSQDDAIYTVDGTYTYTDGEQRVARLYLSNGELRHVFGFTEADGSGAPREIIPEVGDTFTVFERWMDLDASGNIVNEVREPGGTLTFGTEPITWEILDAPVGEYVIGFIVEDLDGNAVQANAPIQVQ